MVHHDLQTVPDYFDWVTLINLRVVASGPVEEVFHEENLKKTYHSSGTLFKGCDVMFNNIISLFSDYTFQTVALGSALLGLISGVLGSFAVLRRQSLLGDGVSHSASSRRW